MYSKKIQGTNGMFHDVPLESNAELYSGLKKKLEFQPALLTIGSHIVLALGKLGCSFSLITVVGKGHT